MIEDSLEAIVADAREVFGFEEDVRPQTRAHNYLTVRDVHRTGDDTAMERVCIDLAGRAYAAGRRDGVKTLDRAAEMSAKLSVLSGELLSAAVELRGQA